MGAVAKRLGLAASAAAESCAGNPGDHTASATDYLRVATHLQRTVGLRINREDTVAHRQHVGLRAGWLPACSEWCVVVRAVTKGLELRRPAPAQGDSVANIDTVKPRLSAQRIGSCFSNVGKINRRCVFELCCLVERVQQLLAGYAFNLSAHSNVVTRSDSA